MTAARRGWRGWARSILLALAAVALVTAAGVDLWLRVGPTQRAEFRGKRVGHGARPAGRTYRVSYDYDAGGRRPSDTDWVTYPFFLSVNYGSSLRVRTFGFGTFRFARLAAPHDPTLDRAAAARWGAVAAATVVLVILRLFRQRRRASQTSRVATASPAG